jgi:hypothetical protein
MLGTELALFPSAHAALTYAFRFSGGAYDRPMMNRMADAPHAEGRGLVGLDGAAQAGMVRQEIASLGPLKEALLLVRFGPPALPCACKSSCCSGSKFSQEWNQAISLISEHIRKTALAGCTTNNLLRREYVLMQYAPKDQRPTVQDLANRHGIDRHTVGAHAGKVATYLGGSRSKKGRKLPPGLEESAMHDIEAKLRNVGLIA